MCKGFFILCIIFFKAYSQSAPEIRMVYDCIYSTTFNQLFGQGQMIKTFESRLIASQFRSVFFYRPQKRV